MSDTTPDPLLTMVYSPTAVVSIKPAAGQVWPGAPNKAVTGTQAQLDALRNRLNLTPLPDPALTDAKKAKLDTLASALNAELLAAFSTAPVWAQVSFSNLAGPAGSITKLVNAGQVTVAATALQGMLDNDQIPAACAPFVQAATAAIAAAEPKFAAVQAATTVEAVAAVS